MKKILIILSLLLGLIWLVAMPALVGSYLDRVVPEWLDEAGMAGTAQFDAGWFTSSLQIEDDYAVDLHGRHVPPLSLAWIRIDGELEAPISPAPIEIDGQFGLTGLSSVRLEAAELAIEGPVQLESSASRLTLNQGLDQASELSWQIEALGLNDRLGNALEASTAELALSWSPSDQAVGDEATAPKQADAFDLRLALELLSDADRDPTLRLFIEASPVQRDALAELIAGLQQWSQAQAQSTARQFALLTIAGAWQQLSQNGLTIRLDRLQIGSDSRFSGYWVTQEGPPDLRGEGSIEALTRELRPIVGLSAQVSAGTAERSIRTWIDEIRQRGWLVLEGDRFEFRYPAPQP